ncbi:MAG: amidohydrolase family protein [Streptosporangiales bacterium]|nr:amidohydrolase family protein [Streptosporangiales bacterium]
MVMLDVLITGGDVVDGTGSARRRADVAVAGDRIVDVGVLTGAQADTVVDATGMVVVPGFVDPHSHTDWTVHTNRDADSTIRQGVTTEIVGNCGISNAPVSDASLTLVQGRLRSFGFPGEVTWRSFGDYLGDVAGGGTAQNLAWFVGHSTVRAAAGVWTGPPGDDELRVMENLVSEAMDAGALGLSTGLEYGHGRFASTAEIERLVGIAGRHDGWYASHIRNRDARLLDSVAEFLRLTEAGGVRGQISHLNVRHDTGAPAGGWERAVAMMSEARDSGCDVQADTTPFLEGIGLMTGVLPDWLLGDGLTEAARRLGDPAVRRRLRDDCDRYWRFIHKGQWERVRLESSPQFPELAGRSFVEISDVLGKDEWDCFFDILAAGGEQMANLTMIGSLFTEKHLADMVSHPLFSLGVDSYSSSTEGSLARTVTNPLAYCGHVHYLTHHVRDRGTLALEEAVRKMTSMPAERFGVADRGVLRSGAYADLAVVDLDALDDVSTFDRPVAYARGVGTVLVNGTVAVDAGTHTGARAGRILTRRS